MCSYCESHNSHAAEEAESHVVKFLGFLVFNLTIVKQRIPAGIDDTLGELPIVKRANAIRTRYDWAIRMVQNPNPQDSRDDWTPRP
jgi:hypothetical protein